MGTISFSRWGQMTKDQLFYINPNSKLTLQEQLQRLLVDAILSGHYKSDKPLASCRKLAANLGVSRNTVALVYERLVSEGYLIPKERIGHFVNTTVFEERRQIRKLVPIAEGEKPNWRSRYKKNPRSQKNVIRPRDWQSFKYPFIYGQPDPALFPIKEWRKCSRQAQEIQSVREWAVDSYGDDDRLLIEEIRTGLLPRRGIHVSSDEILLTLGVQYALYLVGSLFLNHTSRVGIEDPGYVNARNIFQIHGPKLSALPVDESGLIISNQLNDCDFIYMTPSHQYPTTVTMPLDRRLELLKKASESDIILIEDDYESEVNHLGKVTPAIKSLDNSDRVIYVSSLSKSLAPGLRLGYMVGPKELIKEARSLRELMLRHPPSNNQKTVALFMERGNYTAYRMRMRKIYKERWKAMSQAITKHLPTCTFSQTAGGSSFWITGPGTLNSKILEIEAAKQSIALESGHWFFLAEDSPQNCFRLGFSSIQAHMIEPGIQLIGNLIDEIT
jgi:GntR family transcriptional regulator/MocR family aminotransferase